MTNRRVAWFVAIVASTCLLEAATVSAQTCPQNCMAVFGPQACFPVAAKDSVREINGLTYRYSRAAFDLVQGRILANAFSASTAYAQVVARDRYTIVGPPAGTPVSFIVRLYISGSVNQYCSAHGHCGSYRLSSEILDVQSGAKVTNNLPYNIIELPLTKLAEQPFEVQWTMYSEGTGSDGVNGGSAYQTGEFLFAMPPGTSVQSCWGFHPSGVVPTQRTTWGAVKALYR